MLNQFNQEPVVNPNNVHPQGPQPQEMQTQPAQQQQYQQQPQPQPQPNNFSSEPKMTQATGKEEVKQVGVNLDAESIKIIGEAGAIFGETIVNMGIRLFAKTNVYKEFMLKVDHKVQDTKTEDLETLTSVVDSTSVAAAAVKQSFGTVSNVSNGANNQKKPEANGSGFASW